jgi:hypothetical protein
MLFNSISRRPALVAASPVRRGEVLKAQARRCAKACRDALAIRECLAADDPSNTQWQRDLAIS